MKNQKIAQALIAAAFALAAAPFAIAQTQGVSRTEIVIGTEQDLSGPIVAFSKQLKNGMEMRVEEINIPGVGDVDLVVLNLEWLGERHRVAVHLAVLEVGVALLVGHFHAGLAGDVCAVLLEREGVLLQAALRVELGLPSTSDIRRESRE